uniref:WW domain-containing protein n=1 Tax=Acrobeloides nanus TaxID=290746 RepID=A0A914DIF8_9BILA
MSKNSDQIICAYCRKLHSDEKDVFLEAIRKELPNYQNVKCAKCSYTSNNANDVSQHFGKIHGGCNNEPKFELKLNPYLEALCERIFIESQIYTDSGIDTAAAHTLVSDESNLEKSDQDAPIQKAASSLVVESLPEENMADLLKKSRSVFHEKEQIKNQEAKQFSTAVSGTPWHVVWIQDGNNFKLFFYNPSSKTSVWQRPSELYNRKDVDLLVMQPPVGKFMTMPNDLLSTSVQANQYTDGHAYQPNLKFFPPVTRPIFSEHPQQLELNIKPCQNFFKGLCKFGQLCRFSHMPYMETKGYQMAKNQERLKALARSDSKLEINLPRFFEQRFSGGGENREQLMAEQEIINEENAETANFAKNPILMAKNAETTNQLFKNLPKSATIHEKLQESITDDQKIIEHLKNDSPLIEIMRNLNAQAGQELNPVNVEQPSEGTEKNILADVQASMPCSSEVAQKPILGKRQQDRVGNWQKIAVQIHQEPALNEIRIQPKIPKMSYTRFQRPPSFSSPGRLIIDEEEPEEELVMTEKPMKIEEPAEQANKVSKYVSLFDSDEPSDQSLNSDEEESPQKPANISSEIKKPVIPGYDILLSQSRMTYSNAMDESDQGATASSCKTGGKKQRTYTKRVVKRERANNMVSIFYLIIINIG